MPFCFSRIARILAAVEAAPQPLMPVASTFHSFSVSLLGRAAAIVVCATAGSAKARDTSRLQAGVFMLGSPE